MAIIVQDTLSYFGLNIISESVLRYRTFELYVASKTGTRKCTSKHIRP